MNAIKYSISGVVRLFEHYKETEDYIREESRITGINFDTAFQNIDLSSPEFWGDNYLLKSSYFSKNGGNPICHCTWDISIFAPYIYGEFKGEALELDGGGYFKEDENDGVLRLEPSFDVTHKISYHFEASVVSSVPVPAAIYFFLSGLAGLAVVRGRYKS